MTRFFTTTSLLPLVVLALSLSAWQADAADSADPAKALEGLLKPDAAGPLGGTLTGLQYTGFGLSHIKRDDADAPQFDASTLQKGGQEVAKNAMNVGQGAGPAVTSDLAAQGTQFQKQLTDAKDSAAIPAPHGVTDGLKKAGKDVHVPGGTLDSLRRRAGGPKIDGVDVVSFGGQEPNEKAIQDTVGTAAQMAAGVVLKPYIDTARVGVQAAGGLVEGADGAFGAAMQAAKQAQQKQKRVYTPALALFPGAGPEAVELGDQIKNTLGLPTPDEDDKTSSSSSSSSSKGAGQKRFHQKRAHRRHP